MREDNFFIKYYFRTSKTHIWYVFCIIYGEPIDFNQAFLMKHLGKGKRKDK